MKESGPPRGQPVRSRGQWRTAGAYDIVGQSMVKPLRGGYVRRILVLALIVGAALLSTAGTSQAAARWPARCSNFKCVNAHLNALHTQNVAAKKSIDNIEGFLTCLDFAPTTQYPGFFADDGAGGVLERTALDV